MQDSDQRLQGRAMTNWGWSLHVCRAWIVPMIKPPPALIQLRAAPTSPSCAGCMRTSAHVCGAWSNRTLHAPSGPRQPSLMTRKHSCYKANHSQHTTLHFISEWYFIVSRYYAYVAVMLQPLLPQISCVHSAQRSSHPVFVLRSRNQSVLGALQFHLWPLGGQKGFSCGLSRDLGFQLIFFIFTPNIHWTKV